jgi:polyisoprenyl-phosphate glycosyltransferase
LQFSKTLDSRISVIALSRNFGHQAALSAALNHVSADVPIILDGDLQGPQETNASLVAKFLERFL